MTRVFVIALLVAGLMGCARSAPPLRAPEAEQTAAPSAAPPSGTVAPASPPAEESEAMPGTTRPPAKKEAGEIAGATAGGLMEQFDAAEVLALSSGRDCSTACKALRSMNNAAEQLCSIASDDRERERCARARERVRAASKRVKDNCGQCQGGPALE